MEKMVLVEKTAKYFGATYGWAMFILIIIAILLSPIIIPVGAIVLFGVWSRDKEQREWEKEHGNWARDDYNTKLAMYNAARREKGMSEHHDAIVLNSP